jgi:hypothetical protein
MAAPVGNSNASKGREWFEAIRKQCVQREALPKIAAVIVDKALAGEQWAVQEIANRYDGKPVQSTELTGKDGANLFANLTTEELQRQLLDRLANPEMMRALGLALPALKAVK